MFSSEKVKFYLGKMADLGFRPEVVLCGSDVATGQLDHAEFRVSSQQYTAIVLNMLSLTGSKHLGCEIGSSLKVEDLGVMGYAMMTARDFGRMIELWQLYNEYLYGAAIQVKTDTDQNSTYLTIKVMLPPGEAYRFCLDEFIVSTQNFVLNLGPNAKGFQDIHVTYSEPLPDSRIEELVGCRMHYDATDNVLVYPGDLLSASFSTTNLELNKHYLKLCKRIAGEISGSAPISQAIKNRFVRRPDRLPTLEEIAEEFNCTARNLRRKLLKEGCTYRELVNEFRCNFAKEYLLTTQLSNKEIAYALGYNDDKALIYAFKQKTGLTPQEFRLRSKHQ